MLVVFEHKPLAEKIGKKKFVTFYKNYMPTKIKVRPQSVIYGASVTYKDKNALYWGYQKKTVY